LLAARGSPQTRKSENISIREARIITSVIWVRFAFNICNHGDCFPDLHVSTYSKSLNSDEGVSFDGVAGTRTSVVSDLGRKGGRPAAAMSGSGAIC